MIEIPPPTEPTPPELDRRERPVIRRVDAEVRPYQEIQLPGLLL